MQRMSRAQRIILMYLLMKSQEPRLIQRFTRRYVGGGGVSDHSKLTGVTSSQHHTKYTDAEAVTAVEAEDPLTLKNVTMTGNLDMKTNSVIINFADVKGLVWPDLDVGLRGGVSGELRLVNAALSPSAWRDLRLRTLYLYGNLMILDEAFIYGGSNYGDVFHIKSLKAGGGWETLATIYAASDAVTADSRIAISRAGDITMLDQKIQKLGTFTNAQRPAAGTAGRWIFNTDDGMPNYDDGTDWRDINGNIT